MTKKYKLVNDNDGNEQIELEATNYPDALQEAWDQLGWRITESNEEEEEENEAQYINFYHCPEDGEKWQDEWSCMCNDKCPVCNKEITPYESIHIDTNEVIKH